MKKMVYEYTCDCCGRVTAEPVRITAGRINRETDTAEAQSVAELCWACFIEAAKLKYAAPFPEGQKKAVEASERETQDKEDGRQQKTDEQKRPGDLDVPRGKGDGGDSKGGKSAASGSVKGHSGGTSGRRKV